ncbi:MAG: DUF4097 domain-containing protein [Ruminococcaceae bacterium]|nr:DUF4097 domain-containing protein [Oscillospiraceae bacterium]
MKKNVKKLLAASLVIFLLGVIICSAALIYAAATGVRLFGEDGGSEKLSYQLYVSEAEKLGVLPFSSIEISAEMCDVTIQKTDKPSYIEFKNSDKLKTACVLENGVLKIHDSVPFYFLGLTFENGKAGFTGFRHVFSQGLYSSDEKKITVYLNNFDTIGKINIRLGLGNVNISSISTENISVSSSLGNVNISEADISEKLTVSVKSGNVRIKHTDYVFADISCTTGNIYTDITGRKTNCETAVGDITAVTKKDISLYNIRASVSKGDIEVNDKDQISKEYNSVCETSDENIWLKAHYGDIDLYKYVTNE